MTCKIPKVEAGEWDGFDFTRWGLDGVPKGDAGQVLGALAEKLFASPEWRGQVEAGLPDLRARVLDYFDDRGRDLEARKGEQAEKVKTRLASVEREREALQERIKAAAAPPRVAADPRHYQLAARVVEEASGLGLPGLDVQLLAAQGAAPIAAAPTDRDGNAVIVVPAERVAELSGAELAVQVVANDKVIHRAEKAACPRLGHVETWIGAVKGGRNLAHLVAMAGELKKAQEARLAASAEKSRLVQAEHESWRKDLECDEDDVQSVIDDIKKEARPGRGGARRGTTASKDSAAKKRRRT